MASAHGEDPVQDLDEEGSQIQDQEEDEADYIDAQGGQAEGLDRGDREQREGMNPDTGARPKNQSASTGGQNSVLVQEEDTSDDERVIARHREQMSRLERQNWERDQRQRERERRQREQYEYINVRNRQVEQENDRRQDPVFGPTDQRPRADLETGERNNTGPIANLVSGQQHDRPQQNNGQRSGNGQDRSPATISYHSDNTYRTMASIETERQIRAVNEAMANANIIRERNEQYPNDRDNLRYSMGSGEVEHRPQIDGHRTMPMSYQRPDLDQTQGRVGYQPPPVQPQYPYLPYPYPPPMYGPEMYYNPHKKEKILFETFTAKFGGTPSESVLEFVKKIDRQKRMAKASDAAMAAVMQKQLHGVALTWFDLQPDEVIEDWKLLKEALLEEYDNKYRTRQVREQCKNRYKRRDETVNEYAADLLEKLNAGGYNKTAQLDYFIDGLPEYMRAHVLDKEPETLQRALQVANMFENSPHPYEEDYTRADWASRLNHNKKVTISPISTQVVVPQIEQGGYQVSGLGATQPGIQVAAVAVPTKEEKPAKTPKSELVCYNCNNKGHFSRECGAPRKQQGSRSPRDRNQGNRNWQNRSRSYSPRPHSNEYRGGYGDRQREYNTNSNWGRDEHSGDYSGNGYGGPMNTQGSAYSGRTYCCHCNMSNHNTDECAWLRANQPCPTCEQCGRKGHVTLKCKANVQSN